MVGLGPFVQAPRIILFTGEPPSNPGVSASVGLALSLVSVPIIDVSACSHSCEYPRAKGRFILDLYRPAQSTGRRRQGRCVQRMAVLWCWYPVGTPEPQCPSDTPRLYSFVLPGTLGSPVLKDGRQAPRHLGHRLPGGQSLDAPSEVLKTHLRPAA